MEISLPTNWFVMQTETGNFFINFQDKLISSEPPFHFKNLNVFLNNYNLIEKRKEIYLSIKTKYEALEKHMNNQEDRIIKKKDSIKEIGKDEEDVIDINNLESLLKDHVKNKNVNEQEILNKWKATKDILKNLFISKFDTIPIYDFIPLEGDKLKCFIKLKDITISEFITRRNKSIALKILMQRTLKKLFPFSYESLYKGQTREIESTPTVSKIDTSEFSENSSRPIKSELSQVESIASASKESVKVIQIVCDDEIIKKINLENTDEKQSNLSSNAENNKTSTEKIFEKPLQGAWNFDNSSPKSAPNSCSIKEEIPNKNQDFLKKKRQTTTINPEMIDLSLDETPNDNFNDLAVDDKKIVTDHLFEINYNPYSIVSALFHKQKEIKLEESFFNTNEEIGTNCNIKLTVPQLKVSVVGSGKNKHLAKQFAAQILLKKLFPKIKNWGDLVNLHISNKLIIN